MPTELQRKAFEIRNRKIRSGERVVYKDIMKEANYGITAQEHPTAALLNSKGWQQLLCEYDEKPVMDAIYKDALSTEDKRNATENRKLFLKVKGRLNDQIKIGRLDDELNSIFDDK